MNRPSVERRLADWLDEGPTTGPEEVLSNAFARARSMPQDRVGHRPTIPMRYHAMSSTLKVAAVAVFALTIGVVAGPAMRTGPFSASGPSPSAVPLPVTGPLEAGTYVIDDPAVAPARITLTVPAGWETLSYALLGKNDAAGAADRFDVALSPWIVTDVYADACHWSDNQAQIPPDVTAGDLSRALTTQAGREGTVPVDMTLGGYPARRVEMTLPADFDVSTCDLGELRTFVPYGGYLYAPGQRNVMYVVDLGTRRFVLDTMSVPGASDADVAELAAVVESIVIEAPVQLPPWACDTPGPLPAGRFRLRGPGMTCQSAMTGWPSAPVSIELPEGWAVASVARGGTLTTGSAQLWVGIVGEVVDDLCGPTQSFQPPLEPGTDALLAAVGRIPGASVTDPTDILLDDVTGTFVVITPPAAPAGCEWPALFRTPYTDNGMYNDSTPPGWVHRVWVGEVDGVTLVIDASHGPGLEEALVAALDEIVRSTRFHD